MSATPSILIIEDDPAIRALLAAALKRESLFADTATDGIDALNKIRVRRYDLILVDLMMPRMNGIDFITAYSALPQVDAVVIVITAFDDAAVRRLAPDIAERVHAIVHKPFDMPWIVGIVRECAWAKMRADASRRIRADADDRPRPAV